MRNQSGYTAFIAVLIIGTAAVSIGLTLLLAGTDSQRSMLVEQQSKQARALAVACAQEALQQIHDNIAYANSGNLSLGQGTCTYTVVVSAPTTRTVTADGTVGDAVRNLQASVTIGSTTISVTSWQEIP